MTGVDGSAHAVTPFVELAACLHSQLPCKWWSDERSLRLSATLSALRTQRPTQRAAEQLQCKRPRVREDVQTGLLHDLPGGDQLVHSRPIRHAAEEARDVPSRKRAREKP